MTLINEHWYVYTNGRLQLATQDEIDNHFSNKQLEDNYWYNDYS